jgi:hypothetical protein
MDIRALDNCPIALQSNTVNIKNHLVAINEHGLGPADPLDRNTFFWQDKSVLWGISEGDARGRLCNNCEYYFDTPQIRDCVENGPAKTLKASALPLVPPWADIENQPIGYCEKWDITCSPIRTCDAQEIYQRTDPMEEDSPEPTNVFDSSITEYSDLTKSSLED